LILCRYNKFAQLISVIIFIIFHVAIVIISLSSFSTSIYNPGFHAILLRILYIRIYILKINNNPGDPPNRLIFICRAYNTWHLTTRDTWRLTRTPPRRFLTSRMLKKTSRSFFTLAEVNLYRQIKEFSRLEYS